METEKRLTLRLPITIHAEIEKTAKQESRSINGQIVYLLRKALAAEPRAQPTA